jgi:hypothetical protein
LTLNIGLRADHVGQWFDQAGVQVFDSTKYDNTSAAGPSTGMEWNKIESSVPTSGWKSQLFFYNPRLGAAYDVFGTGKTVVRAGFGTYRYQVSSNDASGAMGGPLNSFDYSTGSNGSNGFYGYGIQGGNLCSSIAPTVTGGSATTNCTGHQQLTVSTSQNHGSGIKADKLGDSKVPYANTWSFGVAQALPAHTVLEVSYVGSMSRNQLENGANGHIDDANGVAYGAYFTPDPLQGGKYVNVYPTSASQTTNTDDWRPMQNYGDIWIQTHGGYANYNSLQVAAQKQSGNLFLFTNFTFGKVLGTRDGSTSNGNGNGSVVNPYNLDSNYGPLAYDHTKTFNLSFSYKLPRPIHNNWALGEAINGWQLSGYTTYEDGNPYQANSPNMNMNYQQYHDASGNTTNTAITMPIPASAVGGNTTYSISTATFLGTNLYENGLQPIVVCDPRKGLKSDQYFNPACFAAPLPPTSAGPGQTGQNIWPYIRNPHYWGSDMAIFKAFRVTDAQRIELRISVTNWLNHPNQQFGLAGNADNQLLFNGLSTAAAATMNTNTGTTGVPQNKVGYRWMQFAAKYYF